VSARPFVRIDDPDDPRLAGYREMRERDLAGRRGEFVAEGVVVLEKALAAGRFALESVLVAERKAEGLAGLLAQVPAETPVYLAGQAVMDAVVGFPIHRGVLALGRRGEEADPATLLAGLPERALVVGLVGLSNHDNVGGVFRNAAAFGADAVLLDAGCCDPLYRKAIRVSVGAALITPFAQAPAGADLAGLLTAAGFEVLALSPTGGLELAQLSRPPRCAVLFGAEGPGLPAAILDQAKGVRIPMAGGFDSLNVAVTSGIVLHHVTQGAALAIGPQDPWLGA
jgi:tRNA G18 (ribose-2'-O)-methylase SpoU